jgi:copper homeostasis protein
VNVLIRPREGNFVYNEEEVEQILVSISLCKGLGVNGVVIGALHSNGSVDMELMRRLVAASRPMGITFHRAFDECCDIFAALEDIISLGIDRLLTSGHCAKAWEGRFILKEMVVRADGRIVIMPGCGITPANLAEIAAVTGATEFHGSRIL